MRWSLTGTAKIACAAALLCWLPASVFAQALDSSGSAATLGTLAPGTWVRLEAPDVVEGRVVGRVVHAGARDLTLVIDEKTRIVFPRDAILHTEVSIGERRSTLRGAMIGAGVGVLMGLVTPMEKCDTCAETRGEYVGELALGSAVTGAIVGYFVKRVEWRELKERSLRVGVAPTRGRGVAMGVTLGF